MSWTQIGLDINGENAGDQSGYSVSLSSDGSRVAIGAPFNGNSDSGHVRVYELIGGVWTQLGAEIDGEAAGDQSGYSVSLSADGLRVAIGAISNDGNGSNSGHVRVYEFISGAWTELGEDIDGEAAGDQSGYSVSLSANGSRVAIGAPTNDGVNGADSGHVRVYDWDGTASPPSWIQVGNDIDGDRGYPDYDGDWSGYSVSLADDGQTIAVGAIFNDGIGSQNMGHVKVYRLISETWTQIGNNIDGESDSPDNSGYSVSLSSDGSRVAIGAPFNDGNGPDSGHVRVYNWNGISWTQVGNDIDGEGNGDNSGYSVSLSTDGSRVAIGARSNDGNGSNSGHVRVYDLNMNGTLWEKVGDDIDGVAIDDNSGWSVSLSADGSRVAIGAINNDGNITNSNQGHVRVYEFLTPTSSSGSGSSYPKSTGRIIGADGVPKGKLILNAKSGLSASSYTFTICLNNEIYGENITLKYNTVLPLSVGCDIDIAHIMSLGTFTYEVLGLTVDNGWTKINNNNVNVIFSPNNSKIGCLYKGTLDVIFQGTVMYCDIIVCITGEFSLHPCKVIHGCENYCISILKLD